MAGPTFLPEGSPVLFTSAVAEGLQEVVAARQKQASKGKESSTPRKPQRHVSILFPDVPFRSKRSARGTDKAVAKGESYGDTEDEEEAGEAGVVVDGDDCPPSTPLRVETSSFARTRRPDTPTGSIETLPTPRHSLGYLFLNHDANEFADNDSLDDSPIEATAPRTLRTAARMSQPEMWEGGRVESMYGVVEGYLTPGPGSPASSEGSAYEDEDEEGVEYEDGVEGEDEEEVEGEAEDLVPQNPPPVRSFTTEEAWYFLRDLVGEQLRKEGSQLHKLVDLDAVVSQSDPTESDGDPDEPSFSAAFNPKSVPLSSYLIKHFLLTLPLIRDPSSSTPASHFWSAGLQPLLQSLHDANLSDSLDHSTYNPSVDLGSSLVRVVERFIAAGLKTSSSTDEVADDVISISSSEQVEEHVPVVGVESSAASIVEEEAGVVEVREDGEKLDAEAGGKGWFTWLPGQAVVPASPAVEGEVVEEEPAVQGADDAVVEVPAPKEPSPPASIVESPESAEDGTDEEEVEEAKPYYIPPPLAIVSRTLSVTTDTSSQKKKKGIFGSLLRKRQPSVLSIPTKSNDMASSRRVPSGTIVTDDASSRRAPSTPTREEFFAPMAIPASAMMPTIHSSPVPSNRGANWPTDVAVKLVPVTPHGSLQWGGFEADIVGVRSTLFSKAFLIRVRRPARLDEFVVRTEEQFVRYWRAVEKEYPDAHIRRIPSSMDPTFDEAIQSLLTEVVHIPTPRPAPTTSTRDRALSAPPPVPATTTNGKSMLKKRGTVTGGREPVIVPVVVPMDPLPPIDMKKLPPHDSQRRALRMWLKDTLAVKTAGHNEDTAAFLLLGSIVPKGPDIKDVRMRQALDDARRTARALVALNASTRAFAIKASWDQVLNELVHGDGLATMSSTLRDVSDVDKLPARYVDSIEWIQFSLAEVLHEVFVTSEGSALNFAKLTALQEAFPYFLVRNALKIPKSTVMAKALQDILVSSPFSSKSLYQKFLSIMLGDDPKPMHERIRVLRARIGSPILTGRLDSFVNASRAEKEKVRNYSRTTGMELVVTIARGAETPRLPSQDLYRVIRASTSYRAFAKRNPSAREKRECVNSGVRLIVDLQMYLSLVAAERDASEVRRVLGQEETLGAMGVVLEPCVELIKRVYKVGNGSQALSDLQKTIDQFITILESLRSRNQDPQKGIRSISRLLSRKSQSVYDFFRSVHRGDLIFEELSNWASTLAAYLDRGLAEPISLDLILSSRKSGKASLVREVDNLTRYHKYIKSREFQNVARRYTGEPDADDACVVEGDGLGNSLVDPEVVSKPRRPSLSNLSTLVLSFHQQLSRVFAI